MTDIGAMGGESQSSQAVSSGIAGRRFACPGRTCEARLLLLRMKALAERSLDGTMDEQDRASLQVEMDQSISQISQISHMLRTADFSGATQPTAYKPVGE